MLSGIFSLLCAGLFTVMDAVDVAFTEAAVGAGVLTVLMLAALSMTTSQEKERPTNWGALIVAVLTGALLVYGTLDMPAYRAYRKPAEHRLGRQQSMRPSWLGAPSLDS